MPIALSINLTFLSGFESGVLALRGPLPRLARFGRAVARFDAIFSGVFGSLMIGYHALSPYWPPGSRWKMGFLENASRRPRFALSSSFVSKMYPPWTSAR